MKTAINAITKENFKAFGQVIDMPVNDAPTIAVEKVTFWKQQAMLGIDGDVEVGVLTLKPMDMNFDELENHFKTATGLISLSGDFAIAVGAPSDEVTKAADVQAFEVKQSQLIVLADKCWHSATYPITDQEITLLVLFKKDSLDNDTEYHKMDEGCELFYAEKEQA